MKYEAPTHKRTLMVTLLLVVLMSVVISCATSTNTNGNKVKKLSLEEQYYLGKATMGKIFENYPYFKNESVNDYVRLIGLTLSSFTGVNDDIYKGYSFAVIDTDEPIALASPKGFIVLSKGLVKMCSNEDELASLVSLMIGLNMTNYPIKNLPCTVVGKMRDAISRESEQELNEAFMEAVEYTYETLHSNYPMEELIYADKEAIRMLAKVGYSIDSYKTILQKLSDKNVNDRFKLTSEERKVSLEKAVEEHSPSMDVEEERTKRFEKIIKEID